MREAKVSDVEAVNLSVSSPTPRPVLSFRAPRLRSGQAPRGVPLEPSYLFFAALALRTGFFLPAALGFFDTVILSIQDANPGEDMSTR